jgi:hypothetical protein
MFEAIVKHKNFLGKAHIPDNLDYVNEWHKNYQRYRGTLHSPFLFLNTFTKNIHENKVPIGFSLWGSTSEPWKNRRLTQDETNKLLKKLTKIYGTNDPYIVFGSEADKSIQIDQEFQGQIVDLRGNMDLKLVCAHLNECQEFYGVDTWLKTWRGLHADRFHSNFILKSRYQVDINQVFPGVGYDPSDNIFLKDWNFHLVDVANMI